MSAPASRDAGSFTLVWKIAEHVLAARCGCGATFEAGEPVAVLDWLDHHTHLSAIDTGHSR